MQIYCASLLSIVLITLAGAAPAATPWVNYHANVADPGCPSPVDGFEVEGDFDGNGKVDVARLQENTEDQSRRLAVWMNGAAEPTILDQKPKRYAANFLKLRPSATGRPSLAYGSCEVSERIYSWDQTRRKFKSIQTSD